jgi:hypothetical protein
MLVFYQHFIKHFFICCSPIPLCRVERESATAIENGGRICNRRSDVLPQHFAMTTYISNLSDYVHNVKNFENLHFVDLEFDEDLNKIVGIVFPDPTFLILRSV